MTAAALLRRLDRVRQTGSDRWLARCPAHEDASPSLSVRQLDDGRVLAHCFAGCDVRDVLAAVGLDFGALFPDRAIDHNVPRKHEPFNAHDVLAALHDEALIVGVVGARIYFAENVAEDEYRRMMQAIGRICSAVDVMKPHLFEGHRAMVPLEVDHA